MKFLRHFGAVVAVVAVVVLLGLAWNRFAPSLPGQGPPGEALAVRGAIVQAAPHGTKITWGGTPGLDIGDLLQPVNLAVLRYNAELEAVIIAAVVIASASYRSLRRRWRARTRVSPPVDTDLS